MDLSSATLTIGLAVDHALQRGARIDVATASGRTFVAVTVAALDRFCIVLLDDALGGQAHVVTRDAITSVSMDRDAFLAIPIDREPLSPEGVDEFVFGPGGAT
jgi:hypothetical protein